MKKTQYIVPAIKTLRYNAEAILAGSGPGAGDALLPDITDDPGDGPGAGEFGDTPGLGGNANAMLQIKNVWED